MKPSRAEKSQSPWSLLPPRVQMENAPGRSRLDPQSRGPALPSGFNSCPVHALLWLLLLNPASKVHFCSI